MVAPTSPLSHIKEARNRCRLRSLTIDFRELPGSCHQRVNASVTGTGRFTSLEGRAQFDSRSRVQGLSDEYFNTSLREPRLQSGEAAAMAAFVGIPKEGLSKSPKNLQQGTKVGNAALQQVDGGELCKFGAPS